MNSDNIEKLTRAGLNLIQQALSIFDSDLRLAVCNQRYQEMFGLPDALVTPGASFEDTIRFMVERGEYGEQADPVEAVNLRVETARDFKPHYMERQRANGRWISVEGAPLTQGGWVSVYTDITEIKLQEQLLRARSEELTEQVLTHAERLSLANRQLASTNAALEEAKRTLTEIEARTRLVTEMIPAHIAHINRDLVYTYSNQRMSTLMPGTPGNVVGQHASVVLGPVTFARILPQLQKALRGETAVCELTHDESGRRIRVALTPDPDLGDQDTRGHSATKGIYVLSTDITEETQARAALSQTRKRELAAQLTSGLAHDFANLLTIIMGLQGKLASVPDLGEESADLVRATLAASRRGGTLLQRIGAMSGVHALHPEATDLGIFLEDLRIMAAPSLPDGTRLTIDLQPGLGRILLDQGGIQDSLLNLILNARDAVGPEGGTIHVIARQVRDTWLEFAVEDSGHGFSDEALKRAMDPFFTTKGSSGSGLGLAMVFDQASLSGGSVRATNKPGGGARVTMRLPLRLVGITPPNQTRLVLLVEDSLEIRTHVRETLVGLGHQVIEAETVTDAVALAKIPEISFVLSDIQLRGDETGVGLVRFLQTDRPGIPVGLMTSLPPTDPLFQQAISAFSVLRKPFEASDLARFINNCALASPRAAH